MRSLGCRWSAGTLGVRQVDLGQCLALSEESVDTEVFCVGSKRRTLFEGVSKSVVCDRLGVGCLAFDGPGVSAIEEFLEVSRAGSVKGCFDLTVEHIVPHGCFDGSEYAEWDGLASVESCECVVVGDGSVFSVNDDRVFGDIRGLCDFQFKVFEDDTVLFFFSEDERLSIGEEELEVVFGVSFGEIEEGSVVEDVTVLVNFNERSPFVCGGACEDLVHVSRFAVDGACDEGGVGAEDEAEGIDGCVDGAVGRGLGVFPLLRGGGVLPFGQPVDLVVKEQDFHVHVTSDRVHQVVSTDGQGVSIPGNNPGREVWIHCTDAGSHSGRASVDGVKSVGVHVVGEAAGAADSGDHGEVFAGDPQFWEDLLYGREDRVVATAGAPADVLIGLKVFTRQRDRSCGGHEGFSTSAR